MIFKLQSYYRSFRNRNIDFYLLILLLVFLLLCVTNIKKGIYLIGWDSLQVELDYWLNIKRNFLAAWQEYQGVGLASGHAHAVEFFRLLFAMPLHLILPQNLFRYAYHFLMLLIGVLSIYFLSRHFLLTKLKFVAEGSFAVGLFYLLNLGTVQYFYLPLEPFSSFYAFFPFSLYFVLRYLNKKSPKAKDRILLLAAFLLLSFSNQIQTMASVYAFTVLLPLFLYMIFCLIKRNLVVSKKVFFILFAYVVANFYWLGNAIYFYSSNVGIRFESRVNRIQTPNALAESAQYGNLNDLALLRGYGLRIVDYNSETQKADFMMSSWADWLGHKGISPVGYAFFVIAVIGFIYSILLLRNRKYRNLAMLYPILFFSLVFILNENGVFSQIYKLVSDLSPTVRESFRFSFTKWIVPMDFCYSVFLGIGVVVLIWFLSKYFKRIRFLGLIVISVYVIAITIFSFPVFKGQFIYDELELKI